MALQAAAFLYTLAGHYDEAVVHYKERLALAKRVNGPNHPYVAAVLTNMGMCYTKSGNHGQARSALKHAMVLFVRASGPM